MPPGVFSPPSQARARRRVQFSVTGKSLARSPRPRVAPSKADKTESSSPGRTMHNGKLRGKNEMIDCPSVSLSKRLFLRSLPGYQSWPISISNCDDQMHLYNVSAMSEKIIHFHIIWPSHCLFYETALIHVLQCDHLIPPRVQKCTHRRETLAWSDRDLLQPPLSQHSWSERR